jgi:hypothetical protein
MMKEQTASSVRQEAWDYFALHASQRLTTFNFYIVIATLITTGIFASLHKDFKVPSAGVALGLLLIYLSIVFWKLDERNKIIIKGAEDALKFFETQLDDVKDPVNGPHVLKLFLRDDFLSEQRRKVKTFSPWRKHYSYTTSFNAVFQAFALLGLLGALLSAYQIESVQWFLSVNSQAVRPYLADLNIRTNGMFLSLGILLGGILHIFIGRLIEKRRLKREFEDIVRSIRALSSNIQADAQLLRLKSFFDKYSNIVLTNSNNKAFYDKWLQPYQIEQRVETLVSISWDEEKYKTMLEGVNKLKV